ncbi:hypothetical protein SDD30_16760 [Moorella naiadis]|uniref:hypothetical protein n=1 Tax=Moorella naiadis (nom. illeg.) TaxID=3093670 RepID=UPI003D9CAF81
MKIISVKSGFAPDHSSTSYEFLAVDRPLGKKERAAVASLSRRANPTSRRVGFIYHVDGYDIPGGWISLLEKYYDVMYREDYDWWTLAIAFNTSLEQIAELTRYEFYGEDDLGVEINQSGNRVIVIINCRVDLSCIEENYHDYYENDEEDEEDEQVGPDAGFASDNELLDLLCQVREQLIAGDYRSLYAVWQKYGTSEDEDLEDETPPIPQEKSAGKDVIKRFLNVLE